MAAIFTSLADSELTSLLRQGAVGVLPTDTLYGLVCRAADEQAVTRLYGLKKREKKPGTVIAASNEQLVELGVKARYLKAVEQFWPNALSIEIPLESNLNYLHQGTFRQAFRLPKEINVQTLLKQTGPLLTSSANQPGEAPANTLSEARGYFDDNLDFYVDGGDLSGRKPSTLIRIVDDAIEILRHGAVTMDETGKYHELSP